MIVKSGSKLSPQRSVFRMKGTVTVAFLVALKVSLMVGNSNFAPVRKETWFVLSLIKGREGMSERIIIVHHSSGVK